MKIVTPASGNWKRELLYFYLVRHVAARQARLSTLSLSTTIIHQNISFVINNMIMDVQKSKFSSHK